MQVDRERGRTERTNDNGVDMVDSSHLLAAISQDKTKAAADCLRRLAQNENIKALCERDPVLNKLARRIAHRYIAGVNVNDAVSSVIAITARGHRASLELLGENCRDAARAEQICDEIVRMISQLNQSKVPSSISLDLSHIGALIHPEIGASHLRKIALATQASDRELMISMEDSSRTDLILDTYKSLHQERGSDFSHVGITLQARLHRTQQDLIAMMNYPGRIRLVKGAYYEAEEHALARDSPALQQVYLDYAQRLLEQGQLCSIATHDRQIQQQLSALIQHNQYDPSRFEFETLIGIGSAAINALRDAGMPTREYAVYGHEYFLYVCNRIAEDPARLFQTVIDAVGEAT